MPPPPTPAPTSTPSSTPTPAPSPAQSVATAGRPSLAGSCAFVPRSPVSPLPSRPNVSHASTLPPRPDIRPINTLPPRPQTSPAEGAPTAGISPTSSSHRQSFKRELPPHIGETYRFGDNRRTSDYPIGELYRPAFNRAHTSPAPLRNSRARSPSGWDEDECPPDGNKRRRTER
jgi:hypothetical protein